MGTEKFIKIIKETAKNAKKTVGILFKQSSTKKRGLRKTNNKNYKSRKGVNRNAKDKNGQTLLHLAATAGQTKTIELLLGKGVNINEKDNYDQTPLHLATTAGHTETVKLLLGKGAQIVAENEHGDTPLHLAAVLNHPKIVKLLIEKHANINAKNKNAKKEKDNTPLHLAAAKNHLDMVALLIEKGANIDEKNKQGNTPLHLAVDAGHEEIVKLLIEKHANINEENQDKNTALHLAANRGQPEIVSLLLAKGAKIYKKNKKKLAPLDLAINGGHVEIAAFLLKHGAQVNQCCYSTLKSSMEQQNAKMVELLRKYAQKEVFAFIENYLKHLCPFLEIEITNQDIQLFDKKTGKALSEDAIMNKLDKITQEKFKTVYALFNSTHINQDTKEILEKYRGNPVCKRIKKELVFLINSCFSKPKLSMTYGATLLKQLEKSNAYHLLNSNCSEQTHETVSLRPC